jgi:LysM repeat protein
MAAGAAGAAVWIAGQPAAHASTHVVHRGETLSSIAARYGTSVTTLARMNHLANPNLIVAGRTLHVPGSVAVTSVHVVRPGETLSSIAVRYGVAVDRLERANHLANPNLIIAGQRLKVPGGAGSSPSSSGGASTYSPATVRSTLDAEASAHGVDASLVRAVAWQESGWNQKAVSPTGAVGVMQVTHDTTAYVNDVLGGGSLDRHVMGDNVRIGVMYLHHLLTMFPEHKALAAYNTGPGNVHHRLNKQQRGYVSAVEALKARL